MTQASAPQEDPLAPVTFGSTVTILFSDIRGFTEFTDAYGDEAAYRVLQHHNSLVQEQIELYGGHIVKTLGDSYMVSFDSARTAITCAVEMQRALAQYNRAQQGPKVEIGIGINTGEPVRDAGDFFGTTVNLASRVCAAAGPGQILVSETVRHVVGRMQGSEFRDRGFVPLKGFHEPQHLYEVDWSGAGAVQAPQAAAPLGIAAPEAVAPPRPPEAAPSAPGVAVVRRPIPLVPILVGGLVVLLALGAGGYLLLRPGAGGREAAPIAALPPPLKEKAPAVAAAVPTPTPLPPKPIPTVATKVFAPGDILLEDDFSDPAKGLFPKGEGTTPAGLTFGRGYENGEYIVRALKGTKENGTYAGNASISTGYHYAVEVQARAEGLISKIRYGIVLYSGLPPADRTHYGFQVTPGNGAWSVFHCPATGPCQGLLGLHSVSPFANKGPAANLLRLEVRGSELKVFINGQLLDTVNHEALTRRPVTLQTGIWLREDLKEGEGEAIAAFSQFKVYYEGAPAVAAAVPTPTPLPPELTRLPPKPTPTPLPPEPTPLPPEPTPLPPEPTPLPPKPTPTLATKVLAPGDILYEDGPSDPAKRLFGKWEGTTREGVTVKQGYENGEFKIRLLKGPKNQAQIIGKTSISSDYHYAVETQVRAEGLINKILYGMRLWYQQGDDRHVLRLTPSNGAWNVFYHPPSPPPRDLAGRSTVTPFANKGPAANLLRLEVRGSELKVFINGQLLDTANHEELKKRPVTFQIGIWLREDLKEGEGEAVAAFSRFKVYYLGGP